jgi:hypothetical protein
MSDQTGHRKCAAGITVEALDDTMFADEGLDV